MGSLLALVESLVTDPAAKADFATAPDHFLSTRGFEDLDPDDVAETLRNAADTFPPRLAAQVAPDGGLASVAEVDLSTLGMSTIDDWAAPAPTTSPIFDDDVEFDLGGPGIPEPPPADATEHFERGEPVENASNEAADGFDDDDPAVFADPGEMQHPTHDASPEPSALFPDVEFGRPDDIDLSVNDDSDDVDDFDGM